MFKIGGAVGLFFFWRRGWAGANIGRGGLAEDARDGLDIWNTAQCWLCVLKPPRTGMRPEHQKRDPRFAGRLERDVASAVFPPCDGGVFNLGKGDVQCQRQRRTHAHGNALIGDRIDCCARLNIGDDVQKGHAQRA